LEGLLLAVTAVIVTYNSGTVIRACIDALRRQAPDVAIIVVDNASSDETVAVVRSCQNVLCIANTSNLGFAAAVNQGARQAFTDSRNPAADFVLILNPDVQLATPLNALVDACRIYALAAGQLTDVSGHPQVGFSVRRLPTPAALAFEMIGLNRLWKSNPVNRHYRYLDRDLQQPGPVEQPAGAFLMVRADAWKRLGGMDESFYPVWFEDVDFCRRALDMGYKIEYVPSVTAVHQGGHSVGLLPPGCRALYWCDSLLRYGAKHFQASQYRGVCATVLLGSVARGLAGIVRERNLEPVMVSMRIAKGAAWRLLSAPTRQLASRGD
jgi:N-acetylglucosaminyl-diphospho-decaprenol L-rhamnosyltransferase